MKGWHRETYRHSLAARGIKTSFSRSNRANFAVEIKRTFKGSSRREALYDTIDWLKKSIANPPDDLAGDDLKNWIENKEAELSQKQYEFDRLYSPKRSIKASESFQKAAWEERYRGTKGRKPEAIGDLALQLSLLKSPQEKRKDYEEHLAELMDERAELRALNRIESEILSGNVDDPLTEVVISKIKTGRSAELEPVELEEEEIMEKIEEEPLYLTDKRQSMAYVVGDLPLIAGDAIGTVGAEAVALAPLAVTAGVLYWGTKKVKSDYDKSKKELKKK